MCMWIIFRSLSLNIDPQVFIDEALKTEGFEDCLADLKICIQENIEVSPFYGNYAMFVSLKYMNIHVCSA